MESVYDFPYEPYSIQEQFMDALYSALEERKVAILESPTGTGKSLSAICASLSWLQHKSRKDAEQIEQELQSLSQKIKLADEDDDWVNAHGRKMIYQEQIADVEAEKAQQKKILERLQKAKLKLAKQNSRNIFPILTKRKAVDELSLDINNENESTISIDMDLIPYEFEEELIFKNNEEEDNVANKPEEVLSCTKIIYASRTHSQLEQFASELLKTKFRPRVLTVGSRQLLCVNEAVRSLRHSALINDKCNELLNTKSASKNKLAKFEDSKRVNSGLSKCGCDFAKADAIEDLSDEILTNSLSTNFKSGDSSWLFETGRRSLACPYFASRKASPMCELVLVPYNILLHKGTRDAWNLDLKNNIVIVDEAHNLLQALASIYSCELNEQRISSCCSLIGDYIDRFATRLSPKNLLYIRYLHKFAGRLLATMQTLLSDSVSSSESELVYTIPRFISMLDCMDIDFFKLLSYLEASNLCRKLRDFTLRYTPNVSIASKKTSANFVKEKNDGENNQPNVSRFTKFLEKKNFPRSVDINESNVKADGLKLLNEESAALKSSTPLYQLKEFLEALTTKAEDARILVQKAKSSMECSKFRFLLLNPAEKLKEIVLEARSFILMGGTMKPVDQLLDAFDRVCGVPKDKILQFSCGHVIDETQLIALSIARGPSKLELSLSFSQRNNEIMAEISRAFINLLRHVPNGVVAFFPSYGFLANFINSATTCGSFQKLNEVKSVVVESRKGTDSKDEKSKAPEDVWLKFCKEAKSVKGALLLAVIGGTLSEGINFSDELGRCVIVVGLPYANKNSLEISERMKYVDKKIGKNAGARFYESLCIHSVNQAIGRAIRHRNDYAAIVLLDTRFLRENISSQLPNWIRERMVPCEMFHEALPKLITFFRSKKQ